MGAQMSQASAGAAEDGAAALTDISVLYPPVSPAKLAEHNAGAVRRGALLRLASTTGNARHDDSGAAIVRYDDGGGERDIELGAEGAEPSGHMTNPAFQMPVLMRARNQRCTQDLEAEIVDSTGVKEPGRVIRPEDEGVVQGPLDNATDSSDTSANSDDPPISLQLDDSRSTGTLSPTAGSAADGHSDDGKPRTDELQQSIRNPGSTNNSATTTTATATTTSNSTGSMKADSVDRGLLHVHYTSVHRPRSAVWGRALVCTVAIALLWLTTLRNAVQWVQQTVPSPSTAHVYDTCELAYDTTKNEKDEYYSCVDRQMLTCSHAFDTLYEAEKEASSAAMKANADTLTAAHTVQSACNSAYTTVLESTQAWLALGHDLTYVNDSSVCSAAEQKEAEGLVGDISGVRSATMAHVADALEYSVSVVDALTNFTEARIGYDTAYVTNKTWALQRETRDMITSVSAEYVARVNETFQSVRAALDAVAVCSTLEGPSAVDDDDMDVDSACLGMDPARAQVRSLKRNLEANQANLELALDDYELEGEEYTDRVSSSFDNMEDFYTGVHDVVSALGLDTSGWGSFWSLSLSDFRVSDPVWPGTPVLLNVSTLASVARSVQPAVDAAYVDIDQASVETHALGQQWQADLETGMDDIDYSAEDYAPPAYHGISADNVSAEAAAHSKAAEESTAKIGVSVNAYTELSSTQEEDSVEFATLNLTSAASTVSYLSTAYFTYEPMSGGNYDMNTWYLAMLQLNTVLFAIDYIFRAFKTLRILYKFWNRGAMDIPAVDMRVDRQRFKLGEMHPIRLGLGWISHPAVAKLLGALLTVYFIAILSMAYEPLFSEYVSGCVEHKGNGTFLTSNMYALAYNYASEDGNQALYDGLDAYNVQYSELCAEYSALTTDQQQNDELFMSGLQNAHTATAADMALLSECLDTEELDMEFDEQCCGVNGYDACAASSNTSNSACPLDSISGDPYPLLSEQLGEDACTEDLSANRWSLQNGVFDCNSLPECTVTCDGPDKELLRATTYECGCEVEYFVHSLWLQVALSAAVFLLANLARLWLVEALLHLFWSALTEGPFDLMASLAADGHVAQRATATGAAAATGAATKRAAFAPRADTQQSIVFDSTRVRYELWRVLTRYQRLGYVYLLAAVALIGAAVMLPHFASLDVEYEPE